MQTISKIKGRQSEAREQETDERTKKKKEKF